MRAILLVSYVLPQQVNKPYEWSNDVSFVAQKKHRELDLKKYFTQADLFPCLWEKEGRIYDGDFSV